MLDELLDRLRCENKSAGLWAGKRYEWLTKLSRVDVGLVGAQLYIQAHGGALMGRSANYDVKHEARLIEAKLALRSHQSKGKSFRYQWNSIRSNDDWTHAWLVAVSFESVRAFLVPRSQVDVKNAKGGGQAYWVGSNVAHDTATPPSWLAQHEVKISVPV